MERGTIHRRLTRMSLTLVLATALLALLGTLGITLRLEYQGIDRNLAASARLIAQLENPIAFTIPILDGIPVSQSVVVSWILMAALALAAYFNVAASIFRPA